MTFMDERILSLQTRVRELRSRLSALAIKHALLTERLSTIESRFERCMVHISEDAAMERRRGNHALANNDDIILGVCREIMYGETEPLCGET